MKQRGQPVGIATTSGGVMAIYRLLANASFDPDTVRIMVEAYECACRALELSGEKTDQITELVAQKIVEITRVEVDCDAQAICERSLAELGVARH
jgi:hypothetical protein